MLAQPMNRLQSALDPAGPQGGAIAALWWTLLAVALFVLAGVVIALLRGTVQGRRRQRTAVEVLAPVEPGEERRTARVVATATTVTAIILLFLLVVSVRSA